MREREESTMSQRGQAGGETSMHAEKLSASQIGLYIKGLDFPADKQKLVSQARSNNAPQNVMEWFNKLPDREYNSPSEVEQAFSQMR